MKNKVRTKEKVRLVLVKVARHDTYPAVMHPAIAHAANKSLKSTIIFEINSTDDYPSCMLCSMLVSTDGDQCGQGWGTWRIVGCLLSNQKIFYAARGAQPLSVEIRRM